MQENKMVETVFRFVTVRNPKKIAASVEHTHHVKADLDSAFRNALVSASEEGEIGERNNRLLAEAQNYANGESLISSTETLEDLVPTEFLAFSDWLNANKSTIVKSQVITQLDLARSSLEPEVKNRLIDNLLYYSVIGQANSVTQAIQELLRADQLMRDFDDNMIITVIKKMANAEIILPKQVFTVPTLSVIDTPEPPEPSVDVAQLNQDIDAYSSAISELQQYYSRQREIVKNTYEVDNRTGVVEGEPETFNGNGKPLTSTAKVELVDDFTMFSPATQTLLTAMNVTSSLSLPFIVNELQTEKNKLTRDLYDNANLNQTILKFGGGVWAKGGDNIPTVNPNDNFGPQNEPPFEPEQNDYDGFYYNDGRCRIKPLGIADFRRVEQELCCYKPGEVAHIENILQGEYKERTTRRLRRSEETITTSTESEREQERDTTSTDRFELLKEASKVVQKDMTFDLGVNVSGSYGPVASFGLNSNFSTSTSKTESDMQSVNYAKDVTSRTVESIKERVKEERISKIIEEFEENNSHGLDNRGGDAHIVGLYRWVDKIYKAQVVNYGKRLMFEFMIAEPGAYHLWAMSQPTVNTGITIENPIDPRSNQAASVVGKAFKKHTDIDASNYALLAAQYGAIVSPPPAEIITIQKSYADNLSEKPDFHFSVGFNDLEIPEGYNPTEAKVIIGMAASAGDGKWITIQIGNDGQFFDGSTKNGVKTFTLSMPNETKILPLSLLGNTMFYAININVKCDLTNTAMETWQIDTYRAILDAYENKKAAYEQALAESQAQQGINIQGTNPAMNRTIEQQELKKQCINWLNDGQDLTAGVAVFQHISYGYQPMRYYNSEVVEDGEKAKFMEQAFEWSLMTYKFLPYFYARKSQWRMLYQLDNADPQFLAFLQAGMARVLVPVRPGFEKQMMHFLRTGQVWQGSEVPAINSPIYLSIVEEMQEPIGTVEGEPWEIRVPTSLIILQSGTGAVEGNSLPCDCDPENGFAIDTGNKLIGKIEG
jgi:hypothetical protein